MKLGQILAIALPVIAGIGSGGSSQSSGTSEKKSTGFLSDAASAFLEMSGGDENRQPFQYVKAERPRSVSELTRLGPGMARNMPSPAPTRFSQFEMPIYRSVLQNLTANARNQQVIDMLKAYGVTPTLGTGSTANTKVKMTEVDVK
jgi:hypothetical protein